MPCWARASSALHPASTASHNWPTLLAIAGHFRWLSHAEARLSPLLVKAHDLLRLATSLAATRVPSELRTLLRSMNSYYTNRIEGQHTRPIEIDQALRKDFSQNAALAEKQRLAVAHIEAEEVLEQRYAGSEVSLYSAQAVQDIHRELFNRIRRKVKFASVYLSTLCVFFSRAFGLRRKLMRRILNWEIANAAFVKAFKLEAKFGNLRSSLSQALRS